MARWDPMTEERLRGAAIELFLQHGYENVTVSQIADRAGLTRRSFSRYFADKRDVLFAGSERLPGLMADSLRNTDPELPPMTALLAALTDVGAFIGAQGADRAAQRRAVVARSPELQERGRTKLAEVAAALGSVLQQRGVSAESSVLLADLAVVIFRSGFDRWVTHPDETDLVTRLRETAAELLLAAGDVRSSLSRPAS